MCSPTAAGGILPTGEASIATRTTFNQPPLRLYSTEETNSTSTPYVSYDSSFFQKSNLPAASSCSRVVDTKSGEYRVRFRRFSRSSPRLPVFGIMARVALWGGSCSGWMRLQHLFKDRWFGAQKPSGVIRTIYLRRTYSDQSAGCLKLGRF